MAEPETTDDAPARSEASGSKFLTEFGPILLFFGIYKWRDAYTIRGAEYESIYVATAALMVTITLSVAFTRIREKRWPVMPLITAVIVLIFGGLTLWLQSETFIKIKVTVINGLFGTAFLISALIGKPFTKMMLGQALQLAEKGWSILTRMWIGYFFLMAALNEAVWRNMSTDAWVNFKTFALPGSMLLFIIAQAPVIMKFDISPKDGGEDEPAG